MFSYYSISLPGGGLIMFFEKENAILNSAIKFVKFNPKSHITFTVWNKSKKEDLKEYQITLP